MLHIRLYIVQLFGIVLLFCGYFLSDPPDSLSVMHIDSNPNCPSVITKAVKSATSVAVIQTFSSDNNSGPHKTSLPKHISFEPMLPVASVTPFIARCQAQHSLPLPATYHYLFYTEINPPPPKQC